MSRSYPLKDENGEDLLKDENGIPIVVLCYDPDDENPFPEFSCPRCKNGVSFYPDELCSNCELEIWWERQGKYLPDRDPTWLD